MASSQMTVGIDGTVSTIAGSDPTIKGVYSFALPDAPGVVAANNFMTLFNPLGSGKNLAFSYYQASSYTAATPVVTASMGMYRVTTATAGTDSSASIVKLVTAYPSPVAVVRTGNPSATIGALLNTISPPLGAGSFTSGDAIAVNATSTTNTLVLVPGEGVVFRTTSGDVTQRWNLTIAWAEI